MASRSNPTTESPRRDDAQRGYEEHVQAGTAGAAPEVQEVRQAWDARAVHGSFYEGGCTSSSEVLSGATILCTSFQPLLPSACLPQAYPSSHPNAPALQAVVAGAHEQSMAAAEGASKALHSGGVPEDTPGVGDAVGACFSSRERLERSQRPLTYCMLHRAAVWILERGT